MFALLKIIRDIHHPQQEGEKGERDDDRGEQRRALHDPPRLSLDEYYKVFKAQVDAIDAHGGNAGYHPVGYALHLAAFLKKEDTTKEAYLRRYERGD